jgi:hypothetical protein
MKRASHMLVKGDTCCVGVPPFYLIWSTPCDISCGASVGTLEHMRMCTNGHVPTTQDPPCGAHAV